MSRGRLSTGPFIALSLADLGCFTSLGVIRLVPLLALHGGGAGTFSVFVDLGLGGVPFCSVP